MTTHQEKAIKLIVEEDKDMGEYYCIQESLMRYIDERYNVVPTDITILAKSFWYRVKQCKGIVGRGLTPELAHAHWKEQFKASKQELNSENVKNNSPSLI